MLKNEYVLLAVVRGAACSEARSHAGVTLAAAAAPESFRNERRESVGMKVSGKCAPDVSQEPYLHDRGPVPRASG